MKIKINHEDSYIIIDFDIENEKATIVENNANDFIDIIFGDKGYYEIKRWLISRCGGKKNKGASVVDNITIEIM